MKTFRQILLEKKQMMQILNWNTKKVIFEAEVTEMRDLVELAVNKKINLEFANLYDTDLRGANLSHSNFDGVIFKNANLYGANLSHSSFRFVDFSNANLSHSNLSNSDCSNAIFYNILSSGMNVTNTNLNNANFKGSNLMKVTTLNKAKNRDKIKGW